LVLVSAVFTHPARAELIAEFGWSNPRPVVDPAEWNLQSFPVWRASCCPIPPPETGGSWKTNGDAILGDSPTLYLFEKWWIAGDEYGAITMGVTDSIGSQQDSRPGSRAGISLEVVLNGDNAYLISGGWYGKRFMPQRGGVGSVFFGYDIESLERMVTLTQQLIKVHGRPLTVADADANQDGIVDAADYVLTPPLRYTWWRSQFGKSVSAVPPLSASSTVPEPDTLWVLMTLAVACSSRRRRQRC
jgi:hypothetical protein